MASVVETPMRHQLTGSGVKRGVAQPRVAAKNVPQYATPRTAHVTSAPPRPKKNAAPSRAVTQKSPVPIVGPKDTIAIALVPTIATTSIRLCT